MTGPAFPSSYSIALENFAYHVNGSPGTFPFAFAKLEFQQPTKLQNGQCKLSVPALQNANCIDHLIKNNYVLMPNRSSEAYQ